MECHFIESYEDEREVLRKIEVLKTKGFKDNDMYVIARSNEQLIKIRTRTDVEYHTAEGKGMGRIGTFFKGGPLPLNFSGMTDETRESAFYYLELLEGKILLFCNKTDKGYQGEPFLQEVKKEEQSIGFLPVEKTFSSKLSSKEDEISIDSNHYDTFPPFHALPLRKHSSRKKE
ncbi:general stress protein [Metaplanococcus flavidus]|uniref:General stress protein n=1 Tax=Metaplanococcus flavidus TaxID=569883 RepID=A0ABW3L5R0_9BACL